MSFAAKGGIVAIFATITIGLCVVALFPKVFWVEAEVDLIANTTFTVKSSLWRTCNSTTYNDVTSTHCSGIRKIDISKNIKSEPAAEEDVAAAGLVLAGVFCIFSFIGLCCQHKCATVTLLLIALIFSAATVGANFRYKDHTLGDSYEFTHGYWLACAACAFALFSLFGSCCMNRERAAYENLA